MASVRRGGRTRYRLALLVLTALTLLTLDFRGVGPLQSAQHGARDALDPVRRGLATVFRPVTNAWHGIWDYGHLRDENEQLRAEIQDLQGARIADEGAAATLSALQGELGMPATSSYKRVVARVASGMPGNFARNLVEIEQGTDAGIAPGMAVTAGNALVGRIKTVDRRRATVELVTSPDFVVGVYIGRELALARGTGDPGSIQVKEGISASTEVSVGQPVLTSGQRSRFPPDIPIGRVAGLGDAATGIGRSVTIELSGRPDELVFVSVVLFTPEGG